jgi:hypothetical protein
MRGKQTFHALFFPHKKKMDIHFWCPLTNRPKRIMSISIRISKIGWLSISKNHHWKMLYNKFDLHTSFERYWSRW